MKRMNRDSGAGAIRAETRDGVRTLTLDRPERANAYTEAMLDELLAQLHGSEIDPDVHVVVITGQGNRHFCAGADREEIDGRDWRDALKLHSAGVFDTLLHSTFATIAALNGAAVGGGFELAMACDIRLASDTARFWLPEPEFGLVPAAGGTRLLPLLVGPLRAKDMILGGARWSATDALAAGFLSEVVASSELSTSVDRWVERIQRRDPTALRFAKDLIHQNAGLNQGTGPDRTAQAILVSLKQSGADPDADPS